MSTNFGIINQNSDHSQSRPVMQEQIIIYDDLTWPHDPHTGQPYSMAQLIAKGQLPLPQSNIARLIQQRRNHAADPSLPPETASLAEIRQQEAAKVTEVYYITSPLTAHIIRVSGSPTLAYVMHFLSPPDYSDPVTEGAQFIQFNPEDTLAMIGMLARTKVLMETLAEGAPSEEALAAMGAVLAKRL